MLSTLRAALHEIPNGHAGIAATVRVMRTMVRAYRLDPNLRLVAIGIVSMMPPKDRLAEIQAMHSFVRRNVRYVSDVLDVETLSTPDRTLAMRAGDCDDMATLLATLLESIGIRTRFVVTGYTSPYEYEHVFVEAESPFGWIALDPTEYGEAGEEPPAPMIRATEENL